MPCGSLRSCCAAAIQAAVAQGFGHVRGGDGLAAGQVGDGAGHAQDAMQAARRELQALHGTLEQGLVACLEPAMGHGFRLAHPRIRFAAARLLARARGDDAGLDGGRAFAVRRIGPEFMRRQSRYVHMQVDTVQQGAGQPAAVAPHQVGPAAAAAARVARPSAWAGIKDFRIALNS